MNKDVQRPQARRVSSGQFARNPENLEITKPSSTNERIKELESELVAAQEHLQTTVEELRTANEELQSLNEEMQSAYEELQSTNEELMTLNKELQERTAELSVINSDLENIQQAIGVGIILVDKSCRVTRFTPMVSKIFQISEEYIGHSLTTIPSHLDVAFLREDVLAVIASEQGKSREMQYEQIVYVVQVLPYRSVEKQTVGAVVLFIDKTDDRKAERALAESELRFRQIAEHIQEVFWVTDRKGKTVEYVSPAYERIWGASCQSLYDRGLSWMEAIHPNDRAQIQSAFLAKAKTGEFSQDFRIIRPDGEERWIWDRAFPVLGPDGDVEKLIGIAQDITSRKQAEAFIHEKEQHFRTLFNATFQLMALLSVDGTVLEVNQTLLEYLGVDPKEIVGKVLWEGPFQEMSEPAGLELMHAVATVVNGGTFARYTGNFHVRKGNPLPLELSLRAVMDMNKQIKSLLLEGHIYRE